MTTDDSAPYSLDRRAFEIVVELRGLERYERDARVAQLCGDDLELRQRVMQFFPDLRSSEPPPADDGWLIPDKIGKYRKTGVIGRGGMGVVVLAEDQDNNPVAIKFVGGDFPTAASIERFVHERRALGKLEHPNIARIRDADELGKGADAEPYIVMEYVPDGKQLTEFADQHRLDVNARLRLFQQACLAIQHAHNHGTCHCDIKPSNVLGHMLDEKPHTKVIDLGIARSIEPDALDAPANAPDIAFPAELEFYEHYAPRLLDEWDPALPPRFSDDIYSLGALLYELLAGTKPFSPLGPSERIDALQEMAKREAIRSSVPELPSHRVVRLAAEPRGLSEDKQDSTPVGVNIDDVAAHRRLAPRRLAATLRGELDAIVMRCLLKQSDDRYTSAGAIAEDIERYFTGKVPLQAFEKLPRLKPVLYAQRKFMVRHRIAVTIVALLAVFLPIYLYSVSVEQAKTALERTRVALEKQNVVHEAQLRELADRFGYDAKIRSAFEEWKESRVDNSVKWLSQCPEPLRNWEWLYLDAQCKATGIPLPNPPASNGQILFSSDGRRIAAVGDETIAVWKPEPLAIAAQFKVPANLGSVFRLSADGSRLIYIDKSLHLQVLDVLTGDTVHPAVADSTPAPISINGTHILVYGIDASRPGWTLAEVEHPNEPLAIQPNLDTQPVFSRDGSIAVNWNALIPAVDVFDTRTGSRIVRLANRFRGISCVGANDKIVALGFDEGTTSFWDAQTGVELWTVRTHRSTINRIAVSPSGLVLCSSMDGLVNLLDVPHRVEGRILRQSISGVTAIALSPDGKWAVTQRVNPQAPVLWQTDRDPAFDHFRMLRSPGVRLALSVDGRTMAASSADAGCVVCNARTGRIICTFNGHTAAVNGISFCGGGDRVVSGGIDGYLRVWDALSGREIDKIQVSSEAVTAIAVLGNGTTVLAGLLDGSVATWDFSTKQRTKLSKVAKDSIQCLIPSPDRKHMVVVGGDGIFLLDTTSTVSVSGRLGDPDAYNSAAFSPDGTQLVTATDGGCLSVWDVRTKQLIKTLAQAGRPINCVAMMPDGKRVITGEKDGVVRVWNLDTSQELLRPIGAAAEIESLAISADGSTIYAASSDGYLTSWAAMLR